MRATLPIAIALLSAGCIAGVDRDPSSGGDACPDARAFWWPAADPGTVKVDGVLRSDVIAYMPNASMARIAQFTVPEKWKWDHERIGVDASNGTFMRVGVTPGGFTVQGSPARDPNAFRAQQTLTLNWTTAPVDDCPLEAGSIQWRGVLSGAGKNVAAGDGVSVWYAGFWLNGTLFSTNIGAIDQSGWPRGGWYQGIPNKPLNVYVYDRDRTERPQVWAPTDPRTNQPVEWSYGTTIQGFNAGLKGLTTGSPRVVVIPPEKAYTLPGNEKHRLYGDTLVFYIDVVEIVDVPCPPEVTNRNACRLPTLPA